MAHCFVLYHSSFACLFVVRATLKAENTECSVALHTRYMQSVITCIKVKTQSLALWGMTCSRYNRQIIIFLFISVCVGALVCLLAKYLMGSKEISENIIGMNIYN